jgi:hypothetical protein
MENNYSRKLIKLIEEAEFSNPSTLTFAMLGAKPVNAAEIVLRYCNNDPIKAGEVLNDLIPTVNMAQQSYLIDVLKILNTSDEIKSI